MSLDFVVCRKDASIVAAIELDDATHDAPRRVEADAKKDNALASAGVRLVRWQTRDLPSEHAIQEAFVGSTVIELHDKRREPHLAAANKRGVSSTSHFKRGR
jgi:very-short-patch-repair endonuclease